MTQIQDAIDMFGIIPMVLMGLALGSMALMAFGASILAED